jgi:hypothetical protein
MTDEERENRHDKNQKVGYGTAMQVANCNARVA